MTQLSIQAKAAKAVVKSSSRVGPERGSLAAQSAAEPIVRAPTRRRRASTRPTPPPPQLSHLADEIERVREETRTATARDIHDDIGGALAALKLRHAKFVRDIAATDPPQATLSGLAEVGGLIEAAIAATQGVMRALRPSVLQLGLVAALEGVTSEFSQRTGVRCRFKTNHDGAELPAAQSTAIYRVCQEALTNIAKHAGATAVEVELFRDRSKVTLEITDNGVGLDAAALLKINSYGVRGMRERAATFGGWCDVSGTAGGGTTVMLQIPLRRVQDTVR